MADRRIQLPLSAESQQNAVAFGLLMIVASIALLFFPPKRLTIEETRNQESGPLAQSQKTTTVEADTSALAIAVLTAGTVIAIFGWSGHAITSFKSPFGEIKTAHVVEGNTLEGESDGKTPPPTSWPDSGSIGKSQNVI